MIRCSLLLALSCISCISCFGQPIWNDVVGLSSLSVGSYTNAASEPPTGDCLEWITQVVNTDNYSDSPVNIYSQRMTNTTGATLTICAAHLRLLAEASNPLTVGFWSVGDGTGTQYGSNSGSIQPPSNTVYTTNSFTFATNPTIPTDGVFYLVLQPGGNTVSFLADVSDGSSYIDTVNCLYRDGSALAGGIVDIWFKLDTIQ